MKTKTKKTKLNHFIKIPYNDEGKELLKLLRKLTKECNSKYRIRTKYRSPKEGSKSNWYGDVMKEDATELALYLDDTSSNPTYQEDRYYEGYQEGVRRGKEGIKRRDDKFFNDLNDLIRYREIIVNNI